MSLLNPTPSVAHKAKKSFEGRIRGGTPNPRYFHNPTLKLQKNYRLLRDTLSLDSLYKRPSSACCHDDSKNQRRDAQSAVLQQAPRAEELPPPWRHIDTG
mmetsp:Transcript_22146/g.44428  ORF Transcript_22146/g.44428 Transcript_22146/m.44428 type:complete len:100 (+) Transcript_22146:398-697(+)